MTTLSPQLLAALRSAYANPSRAYHNFSHVEEVLGHMASVPHWENPTAVELAILFHDAIYEIGKPDNEARSADLAADWIARYLPQHAVQIRRVQQLIVLTARHGRLDRREVDHDEALFLDCDMAVLGGSPERFQAYELAIAEEYRTVPKDLYRIGRAQFLSALLAKANIYLSPLFEGRFEARARANISHALADHSAA